MKNVNENQIELGNILSKDLLDQRTTNEIFNINGQYIRKITNLTTNKINNKNKHGISAPGLLIAFKLGQTSINHEGVLGYCNYNLSYWGIFYSDIHLILPG